MISKTLLAVLSLLLWLTRRRLYVYQFQDRTIVSLLSRTQLDKLITDELNLSEAKKKNKHRFQFQAPHGLTPAHVTIDSERFNPPLDPEGIAAGNYRHGNVYVVQ